MDKRTSDYWNSVAEKSHGGKQAYLIENVWKRQAQVSRLLQNDFFGKNVLEVGCGNALIAATINMLLMGNWNYIGTDISSKFCWFAKKNWGLTSLQLDFTELQHLHCKVETSFDYIWFFDVLEHICADEMNRGFEHINELLAPSGKIVINNPSPSNPNYHHRDFEFGFDEVDLEVLLDTVCGRVIHKEPYSIKCKDQNLSYEWIVVERK